MQNLLIINFFRNDAERVQFIFKLIVVMKTARGFKNTVIVAL